MSDDNPTPEEERYERLEAERIWKERKKKGSLENGIGSEEFVLKYEKFLDEVNGIGWEDVEKKSKRKRKIFERYFGEKYTLLMRKPVSGMDDDSLNYFLKGEVIGAKYYLKK